MAEGVDYFRPAKKSHKGSCLDTLEMLMKDWLGGSYLVLKITPRVPGDRPLMYIGYKYNSKKVLVFIANKGYRSTEPSDSCLSSFPDINYNVSVSPVFHTSLSRQVFKCL